MDSILFTICVSWWAVGTLVQMEWWYCWGRKKTPTKPQKYAHIQLDIVFASSSLLCSVRERAKTERDGEWKKESLREREGSGEWGYEEKIIQAAGVIIHRIEKFTKHPVHCSCGMNTARGAFSQARALTHPLPSSHCLFLSLFVFPHTHIYVLIHLFLWWIKLITL